MSKTGVLYSIWLTAAFLIGFWLVVWAFATPGWNPIAALVGGFLLGHGTVGLFMGIRVI